MKCAGGGDKSPGGQEIFFFSPSSAPMILLSTKFIHRSLRLYPLLQAIPRNRYCSMCFSHSRVLPRSAMPSCLKSATAHQPTLLPRLQRRMTHYANTKAPIVDTIYALSTSPGKAGVAIIRISGPRAKQVYTLIRMKYCYNHFVLKRIGC